LNVPAGVEIPDIGEFDDLNVPFPDWNDDG
jgi:hypothetical protein